MTHADLLGYGFLLLKGCWVTIQLFVFGCALALVLAFCAGLAKLSKNLALRWAANCYIEFFRGSSIYIQLFWVFFVLPLFGLPLPPMIAGIVVLGLNVSAYSAEVVRAGILAVPRDQYEACVAVNLTPYQRLRHVILPQAFLYMLPPLNNNAIELLKGTAVVSLITITDMAFQAQMIRSTTGNTAFPFVTILILYYLIAMTITHAIRALERRMARGMDVTRA